jgi:hypothetical protein
MDFTRAAWERAMKVQEIFLQAMSGAISWLQAAEIIGVTPRSMRRWRNRYESYGYDGLLDRRRRKPSSRAAPFQEVQGSCGCIGRGTEGSMVGTFIRLPAESTA